MFHQSLALNLLHIKAEVDHTPPSNEGNHTVPLNLMQTTCVAKATGDHVIKHDETPSYQRKILVSDVSYTFE